MVRGSVIRVTALDKRGRIPSRVQYAVTNALATITIDEVSESGANEMIRNEEEERRLLFVRAPQTIRYKAGIDFLRCDPSILSLVSGVPTVTNADGDIVGFDGRSRLPANAFALEVWTRLTERCADGTPQWGYTVFPYLKGGVLSGFAFSNGLVAFDLVGAQTRRYPGWADGPFGSDMTSGVSGNTAWRQTLTALPPPEVTEGVVEFEDAIEGGNAMMTGSDVVDGQFVLTSNGVVNGGTA